MTRDTETTRSLAAILAFAQRVSPHMGDKKMFALSEALADHCHDALTRDLTGYPFGETLAETQRALSAADVDHWVDELANLAKAATGATVVCHDDYPINLRMVFDRPPVLFFRGSLVQDDSRSVSVVGTRNPSDSGLALAGRLAAELAKREVTIVSGMARGIDTAAHAGAMNAGGRTIAVLGQGICTQLPRDRSSFANAIARSGVVMSQFWPNQPATNWTFPIRNRVTSGLSLATVVVEAGPTSGAKLQALDALNHGRRVFLVKQLVLQQDWAKEMQDHPGVSVLDDDLDELITAIDADLSLGHDVLV